MGEKIGDIKNNKEGIKLKEGERGEDGPFQDIKDTSRPQVEKWGVVTVCESAQCCGFSVPRWAYLGHNFTASGATV